MSAPVPDIPPYRYTAALAGRIEAAWQDRWAARGHVPRAPTPSATWPRPTARRCRPTRLYLLDMFPYPSGAGLHVGHPLGYIGTDVLGPLPADDRPQRAAHDRLRRLRTAGRAVRHPHRHPPAPSPPSRTSRATGRSCGGSASVTTSGAASPPPIRSSSAGPSGSSPGCSRPGTTPTGSGRGRSPSWWPSSPPGTRPMPDGRAWAELTRVEQRRVLDRHRLAYVDEGPVNWCPGLGTVLSNEEVTPDGRSAIGNFPVFRRSLRQWMMRITAYADRLIDDLDRLDWPESVKIMQRNWIGRSTGARVRFAVVDSAGSPSRSTPPGRTRCSGPPTWCWPPSTRWWTRSSPTPGRRAPTPAGPADAATPAEAVAAYRREAARQVRPGPAGEQGEDRRLHRCVGDQPGERRRRSRSSSPTTC